VVNSALKERYIIGRNAVREVLRHHPERVKKVYLVESVQVKDLTLGDLPVEYCTQDELTALTNSSSHQSIAVLLCEHEDLTLKGFLREVKDRDRAIILMLDSIMDPHNMGAMLRAAECFGVAAVVWSKNRGVDLTPTVSKVSVGASELLPLIPVSNLVDAVKKCKGEDFWVVAATVGEGTPSLNGFEFPEKTVLVIGSEEKGPSQLLLKQADFKVKIPLFGKIDSLNVSQATAVLLNSYQSGQG